MYFHETAKASKLEVHLYRKEIEIQASNAPNLSHGIYHIAAKICAKSMVQSFVQENSAIQNCFCFTLKITRLQQPKRIRLKNAPK